jgi:hypothetical protein
MSFSEWWHLHEGRNDLILELILAAMIVFSLGALFDTWREARNGRKEK